MLNVGEALVIHLDGECPFHQPFFALADQQKQVPCFGGDANRDFDGPPDFVRRSWFDQSDNFQRSGLHGEFLAVFGAEEFDQTYRIRLGNFFAEGGIGGWTVRAGLNGECGSCCIGNADGTRSDSERYHKSCDETDPQQT